MAVLIGQIDVPVAVHVDRSGPDECAILHAVLAELVQVVALDVAHRDAHGTLQRLS